MRVLFETVEIGKTLRCNGQRFAEIRCSAKDVTINTLVTFSQETPL